MGSLEWRDVERVLDQALDLEPQEWPSFLDERCSGQPELRLEVESLLRASEATDTLLDRGPQMVGRDLLDEVDLDVDADGFEPGRRVDRYEVIRLLGRGGQGTVYLAQRSDGVFDKQVALKVVKRGMVTEEVLTRFRDERQILADLEHPNIAGILDGGVTEDGLPFLVMEHVDGEPIDDYCDRQLLGVRERLRLFITVCEAVHHAHRNLILHRDLKPGNILVAEDGTVKLLDFGIARVMEPHGSSFQALTQAAVPRLTPEYAAPEQVMGMAMTTATDVYALGVVLYELLSGLKPYEITSRTLMAVQRVVSEANPALPSKAVEEEGVRAARTGGESVAVKRGATFTGLRDVLRGDLDSIVMKALEKEPELRYRSAADLMRDIERHLGGRTVEARTHTRWYRATKFVRRNAVMVAVVTAAFVALGLGLAGTTWQWTEARRQSALRQAAADRAEAARGFMVQVFEAFDPDELQGREMTPSMVIDQGLQDVRTLDGRPELQRAALNSLGQIALRLGETDRADSIFNAALALQVGDTAESALDLTQAMRGRAAILRNRFEGPKSVALLREALALQRSVLEPDDPGVAAVMIDLAFSLYAMAGDSGDAEARALLEEAESFQLSRLEEARRLQYLGDVNLSGNRTEEAITLYRRSLEEVRAERGADHPEVGRTLLGVGGAERIANRFEDAEESYGEAVRIFERNYGPEHLFTARALNGLSFVLFQQQRFAEAIEAAAAAVRATDADRPAEARLYAIAKLRLARALQEAGDTEQSIALFQDLLDELSTRPEIGMSPGPTRYWLAKALLEVGRAAEALSALDGLSEADEALLEHTLTSEPVEELRERAAISSRAARSGAD